MKGKKKKQRSSDRPTPQSGDALPGPIQEKLKAAIALHQAGRIDEAAVQYREILEQRQNTPDALHLLGLIAHQRGNHADAITLIGAAINFAPRTAVFHFNRAIVHQAVGALDKAIEDYEASLALNPGHSPTLINLLMALLDTGQFKRAEQRAALELKKNPSDMIAITLATLLPTIMGTREEVVASRERFEREVDRLLERDLSVEDFAKEGSITNFYLAYHGFNDRALQEKVARLRERACPSLLEVAPHCQGDVKKQTGKIRIGFISRYLRTHSVTRCYGGVIRGCAEHGDIEVVLLSFAGERGDAITSDLAKAATGGNVQLPNDLKRARTVIADLQLDALIYLDIGMDPLTHLLAFARLAPVQCVMTGHPVTTGIGNVDYFLSWAPAEPPDADDHYSEKLVRFEHGGVSFEMPALPASPKSRKELGLPETGPLCACPVALIKVHPDFDEALAGILSRDANAKILFFQNPQKPAWHEQLQRRMAKTVPAECLDRLLFLPWINTPEDFLSMLMAVDVVLDPFHFGAHSTATQVYAAGTPLVTLEGRFLRERVGMAFNQLVGVPECTAQTPAEYVDITLRLLHDSAFREGVRKKIEDGKNALFEERRAADELVEFLQGALSPEG